MVYRLTGAVSVALFALVIARLGRVFLPVQSGLPWPIAIFVATALGALTTWIVIKARFGPIWVAVANAVLFGLFVFLYVGADISGSTIPPLDVVGSLFTEMRDALEVFRFASPPVIPLAGLVALTALMMWILATIAVWGLLNNAPYLAIVPPVVFYLQLAVIDRQEAGPLWTVALLLAVGVGLTAIASDQRAGGGHAGHGRQAARIRAIAVPAFAVIAVTAVAMAATTAFADTVPSSGVLDWRSRTGIGTGYGSISYNPFIDVRRSLVSNSNAAVFTAEVSGDVDPGDIYWQLLTMDSFNGDWWYASDSDLTDLEDTVDEGFEDPNYAFRGDTETMFQQITIRQLQSEWLPAAYSPNAIGSEERLITNTTRVDPSDGSLHVDGVTRFGMQYVVRSEIPQPNINLLAVDPANGELSPLFDTAAKEGRFPPVAAPVPTQLTPRDIDRYTELPRDFSPFIIELAEDLTIGLRSDYEKALALENFFRGPNSTFTYSLDIDPNERDSGLQTWLLDSDSPGYRTGYCEQFSASMAAMARALGIPTRTVLGFTPGTVRSDGSILVQDRNAHAWVEVWIASQGWVRFDPTPRGDGVNPSALDGVPFGLDRYLDEIERAELERLNEGGGGFVAPPDFDENPERFAGGSGAADEDSRGGINLPSWFGRATLATIVVLVSVWTVPLIKARRRRRRMKQLESGDVAAAWAELVDRLIDSGVGVSPASTALEIAADTDPAMVPLAAVYGRATYGPEERVPKAALETATLSLGATERQLRSRQTRWQRLRRVYRMRSLLPSWIKRSRRRA